MALTLPTPVLVAAGLIGTGIDTLKRLPEELPALPVTLVGRAVRLSMKVRQDVADLAGRGEELLSGLTGGAGDDSPSWARFDDDEDEAPTEALSRPGGSPGAARAGGPAQAPTVLPDPAEDDGAPSRRTPSDSPGDVADPAGTTTTRTRRAAADAALDPLAGGSDALLSAAVGEPSDGAGAASPAADPDFHPHMNPHAPDPTAPNLVPPTSVAASAPIAATATAEADGPGLSASMSPSAATSPSGSGGTSRARRPKPVPTSVDAVAPERRPNALSPEDTARSAAAAARTRRAATAPGGPGSAAHVDSAAADSGNDTATADAAPTPPATDRPGQDPTAPAAGSLTATSGPGASDATADRPTARAGRAAESGPGTPHPAPGADPAEPDTLAGYGGMTVAQVRGHLGELTAAQVADLLLFEQQHRGRAPFLTLLTNRITTLGQSAE